ncbi:MAG TPA: ATP-binding protein, partial [Candidatus Thermoplasmatota archaeon]|nr:ATP-binding protein [Candidatus Thermoplasmatota archaeon]
VAVIALVAAVPALGRRVRSVIAAFGLMSASAILIHLSGGYIEAHFHIFVMLGVISLYEDWMPFLLSIGYVLIHHGVAGSIDPTSVFNHAAAFAAPWTWAIIHAVFVLGLSAANIVTWRVLERTRARADVVLDSAGEGIFGVDAPGRVTFANPAAASLAGARPSDLVGLRARDLLREMPEDLAGSGRRPFEAAIVRRGGPPVPVECVARPILRDGVPGGVVLTVRDISERKRAEAEIHAARAELAASEKLSALGTLVAGVAHEIRTPLTYVTTNAHLARVRLARASLREPASAQALAEVDDSLKAILEGSDRIQRLVADLRRFHEPRASELVVAALDQAIAGAVDLFRATHRDAASVDTDFAPTPPCRIDKVQVQQVVLNLLANAAEASPRGRVRIATRAAVDAAELVIEDDGPGIPLEVQERMFEPFYTTKADGTGLGLAIARRIVTAHGGTIRCESRLGAGARFVVRFPAAARAVLVPT